MGEEFGLEHGPREKWFNDCVGFIGLQSKSNTIVFRHSNLVLKAADWHEMLAHKLTAFRGVRDVSDAVCFLREIQPRNKATIYKNGMRLSPGCAYVADDIFEKRFNTIRDKAYGNA